MRRIEDKNWRTSAGSVTFRNAGRCPRAADLRESGPTASDPKPYLAMEARASGFANVAAVIAFVQWPDVDMQSAICEVRVVVLVPASSVREWRDDVDVQCPMAWLFFFIP